MELRGRSLRKLRTGASQVPAGELLEQRPAIGIHGFRGGIEVGPVFVTEPDGPMRAPWLIGHPANPARCTYRFQRDLLAVYVHLAYSGVRTPASGETR